MSSSGLGLAADERIVRTISADKATCAIHLYHSPIPAELYFHHIWPLGMGGPEDEGNLIVLCPTGHANVHHLLRIWVKLGGKPPWTTLVGYSVAERELAERAWALSRP